MFENIWSGKIGGEEQRDGSVSQLVRCSDCVKFRMYFSKS